MLSTGRFVDTRLQSEPAKLIDYIRNVDVTMLQMLNTQERSEAEWQEVVSAADPALELTQIIKPKGSWDSIIEISLRSNQGIDIGRPK